MTIMRPALWAALAVCLAGPASAEEQTLNFRFTTTDIEAVAFEAPNTPGRTVSATRSLGTAIFEDGRIAVKAFVYTGDSSEAGSDFGGYSTYTFQNGDALNFHFTGSWSPEGELGGEYELISGTGAYEGATGTGSFKAMDYAWEGADLWEGQFVLTVPGS